MRKVAAHTDETYSRWGASHPNRRHHHGCESTRFVVSPNDLGKTCDLRFTRAFLLLEFESARVNTSWTVFLSLTHTRARIGYELQDFVAKILRLSPHHGDLLVLSNDPRMVKNLSNVDSLLPVLDKEFGDEIFAFLRDVRPDCMIEGDFLIDRFSADFLVILTVKRKMATKHQVDDDAKRPTVNTLIIRLLH